MFAVVTPDTIHLPPGAVVRLPGSWQDYQALNEQLGDRYTVETNSRYFPNINVSEVVTESLKIAYERNTSAAIRELRRKLASEN
ncbi:hypothetical protein [Nostoc sp. ChiSLP03a]|uniref:hypothetical protein n=1 Tax=Nostoc sp. ChiSLP03a TaxID=3075380 RepID=UPI002AD42C8E|nr:hypothetical protein [Nostoc sp. ChiSLP03a]MDZ8212209.1 hypothetical protein [Nostoc sp. ChiSLP03a]